MTENSGPSQGSMDGLSKGFRLRDFTVYPEQGNIVPPEGEPVHIEDVHMKVLVELARAPHQILSTEHFMNSVWENRIVEPGNLQGAITRLRRTLGCNARSPTFIRTHQSRGYELLVDVEPLDIPPSSSKATAPRPASSQRSLWFWAIPVMIVALSLALLPFLDIGRGH